MSDPSPEPAERPRRGFDGLPHRFEARTDVEGIREAHEQLEAGEETDVAYRVAGRVMGRRGHGKAAFLDLEDRTGRIQLLASLDGLGEERFGALSDLLLGDVIGAEGVAVRSRRGELSLKLTGFELLAPNERPMPDLHHGLADIETRYRQRYLDLMVNPEARTVAQARSRLVTSIRRSLDAAGFIEVETPVLQPLYGGALARPFTTHHNALERDLYLRIATELYLKRLIVGGLERVYELAKDFRNEGVSYKHNPEFTMVEWYEAYADHDGGMERTENIIAAAAEAVHGSMKFTWHEHEIDLTPPWPRRSLASAIEAASGIDPVADRDPERLRAHLLARGVAAAAKDATWAQLVDRLLSHDVEPNLVQPTFLVDYPRELSPLARPRPGDPTTVERFEAFMCGMEVANGYSELNDPEEQLARFVEQSAAREAGDAEAMSVDHDYVEALRYGMPPTAGVGLGIDRLAIPLLGQRSIRDVILFPAQRT